MNILLYTPVPPNKNYSGGLMLYQMCKIILKKHKLSCFTINNPDLRIPIAKEFRSLAHRDLLRPFEKNPISNKRPLAWLWNYIIEMLKDFYVSWYLVPEAVKFGRKSAVDCVWAVIQGKSIIISAEKIARKLKVPLITQVWDDPSWSIIYSGLDLYNQKMVWAKFDSLIKSSQLCGTASWAMSEQYNKKYNIKTVPLVASLDSKIAVKPNNLPSLQEINIVLAGQLYAVKEWQALTGALESQGWRIEGKRVKIHLIGNFDKKSFPKDWPVEVIGSMDQENLIMKISHMNIGYCPYWFDKEYKRVALTSFPSKLSSYLAAGCPVLFHGPEYSSPAKFIEKNGGGVCCYSLDHEKIINSIKQIIASKENYQKMSADALNTFKHFLTMDEFAKNVNAMFDLSVESHEWASKNKRSINVLQVGNNDLLGRRFNGYDLIKKLNSLGVGCILCVWQKYSSNDGVWQIAKFKGRDYLQQIIEKLEKKISIQALLYPFYFQFFFDRRFWKASVIHYHLIHSSSFSLFLLPILSRIKPTVWTLHDPWAMTGHCLYPFDCDKWKSGCGKCPNLSTPLSIDRDHTSFMWKVKKIIYKLSKIDVVLASKYMLNMAKQSPLLSNFKLHYIPFGLDLNIYSPDNHAEAKKIFGISPSSVVISFRSTKSEFKGLEYIKQALIDLQTDKEICLLAFHEKGLLDSLKHKYKIIDLGWENDETRSVAAYNASDIFLMPSTAEAFGMMAIEAMACGKPVITFSGTSLEEVIDAPRCGISVPMGDVNGLRREIKDLIEKPDRRKELGKKAREFAINNYNERDYINRLISLYKKKAQKHM